MSEQTSSLISIQYIAKRSLYGQLITQVLTPTDTQIHNNQEKLHTKTVHRKIYGRKYAPNIQIPKPKPKPTGPSSPVRTASMNVYMVGTIVVCNTAQNSSDNLSCYPPYSHHCSDVVYWRKGVK